MNTDKIYAESIANEYSAKEASKVVALKKLDRRAKLPSTVFTFTLGIVGTLVFGTGMCLGMGVIGDGTLGFILGIIIGIFGMILCSVNYPIYKAMRKRGMKKYAGDIMLLAKEISEN